MPIRPRDPVDKVLIRACGDGLPMSTLGQKADIIKERLAEAGYRIELDPEFLLRKGRDEGVVLK